jgi:DNA-binding NarL/FixJ family response regulator
LRFVVAGLSGLGRLIIGVCRRFDRVLACQEFGKDRLRAEHRYRHASIGCIVLRVNSISVLVVDDHVVFADAVRSRLELESDLHPIAVAYGLDQAMARLDTFRPDVALVDLRLADGTGIDFAERARVVSPKTSVAILSAVDSTEAVVNAALHGVRVWLPKTVDVRRLVRAVRLAHRGGAWFPQDVLGSVLDELVERARSGASSPLDRLSDRELEVLSSLADGKSRAVIAAELHLSLNTVRSHVQHIIGKLDVHSTLEAVAMYNRAGHRY